MRPSIPWALAALAAVLLAAATALAGLTVWAVLSICLSLAEIGVSQPWPTT